MSVTMTRKFILGLEGGSDGCSAYVPELPAILVTGDSAEHIVTGAKDAIRLYLEEASPDFSPTSVLREIEVDVLRD